MRIINDASAINQDVLCPAGPAIPARATEWQQASFVLVQHLYQWSALLAIFGWGYYLLNRPFRWLPYATEAVYPWYTSSIRL